MTAMTTVFDRDGHRQALAPLLAQGGEGAVYPLLGRADVVVKCYHPEVLRKRGKALEAKVAAMVDMKERFRGRLCWPSLRVFDGQGQWVGYAMRRAQGAPMFKLAHTLLYEKHFPGLNRLQLVDYLISFLDKVNALHAQGVRVGDFNLQNVLCHPGSTGVDLIDCDSFQVETGGRLFHCPVGSPDMTAPEQQNKAFEKLERTLESEYFSVAIVLFKCLMLGRHPYDMVGGEDPVSNIRNGHFPYGEGSHGIPKGPWYNIWSHMPFRVKSLFIQAFTEGARDPNRRPDLAQWRDVLRLYRSDMNKGWHELSMKPAKPKAKTYKGSAAVGQRAGAAP